MEGRFLSCYREWYRIQSLDLDEIVQVTSIGDSDVSDSDVKLRELVAKSIRHYEDYYAQRRALIAEDAPTFFAPPWCNSFECALLWLGGCRPSMFIRLLYSLSSASLEAGLHYDNSEGASAAVPAFVAPNVKELVLPLSAAQLNLVNEIHCKTLQEEHELTSRMATLQENVADWPLFPIVEHRLHRTSSQWSARERPENEGTSAGVNEAGRGDKELELDYCIPTFDNYEKSLAGFVEEADRLRMDTARELLARILTPKQAVMLLAAAKKLHLSIHEWSQQRDENRRQDP